MCFVAAVKNLTEEKNQELEDTIKSAFAEKLQHNDDGFFIHADKKDWKTLNVNEAYSSLLNVDINGMFLHFRQKSTGDVVYENIHGWKHNGWQFVHNGIVSKHSGFNFGGKDVKKTDSEVFFNRLMKRIANDLNELTIADKIREQVDEDNFSGRALLYHQPSDRMFLFGDFEIYTVNDKYLVIASTRMTFDEYNEYFNVHGFFFKYNKKVKTECRNLDTGKTVGVIYDWTKPNFKYELLIDLNPSYFNKPLPVPEKKN